ncbi:MAG: ABC transporter ATP-binding protein [Clostridia bacterium]|nr:ABC transporter ATP-binding protein [Clostridia bacterium]
MPLIIKNLKKSFGEKVIFDDFSYTFDNNGIYILVGDSGRGKTTLLRMIAGLDNDYTGEIITDQVAYVFQEYRLFPVLNAIDNIAKILWIQPTDEQIRSAASLLSTLGFSKTDMQLYPNALSGGMKQRVSLCRALLADKKILLLDEPFKELDSTLREQLRTILAEEAKKRLILLSAHSLDALGDLDRTVIEIK